MLKNKTNLTFADQLFSSLIINVNLISQSTNTSLQTTCLLMLGRWLLITLTLVDFENIDVSKSFFPIIKYAYYIMPHKLPFTFNPISCEIFIIVVFLINTFILFGFLKSPKKNKKNTFHTYFGHFVYIYQYMLIFPMFGLLLSIFNSKNALTLIQNLIFKSLFILALIYTIFVFSFVLIVFCNFRINVEDYLARNPNLSFFFTDLLFLLVVLFNTFLGGFSNKYQIIASIVISAILLINFLKRFPFIQYETTMFYLFTILLFILVVGINTFCVVFPINHIQNNFLIIFLFGAGFIFINICLYYNFFYDKILFNENQSALIFYKKLLFLFSTSKIPKSNQKNEKRLIKFLSNHFKSCKNDRCACQTINLSADVCESSPIDSEKALWKNDFFMKELIKSICEDYLQNQKSSCELEFFHILFSFEVLRNVMVCNYHVNLFLKNRKKWQNIGYLIAIYQIENDLSYQINEHSISDPFIKNKYELVVEFDHVLNELKESIMKNIHHYQLFWLTLSENTLDLKKIKLHSENVLKCRKANKIMFARLETLFPLNKEVHFLMFLYKNFVIWEPYDVRKYKKSLQVLDIKLNLEKRNSFFLNPFDFKSCIICVNINEDDMNKIVFTSNNTQKIFEADKMELTLLKLDKMMPQTIGKVHTKFMKNIDKTNQKSHLYVASLVWFISAKGKLFQAQISNKILMINQNLVVFAYIRANCYKKYLILNKFGEIDSFGEFFQFLTKLDYKIGQTSNKVSIFLFLPSLIPLFLQFFYEKEKFCLQNFSTKWLKTAYFFTYKNQAQLISTFDKTISNKFASKMDYCQAIYAILSKLTFKDVSKVYRVSIDFEKFHFSKNNQEASMFVFEISKIFDVTNEFSENNFKTVFAFLEKFNFNSELLYSLNTYQTRFTTEKYRFFSGLQVFNKLKPAVFVQENFTKADNSNEKLKELDLNNENNLNRLNETSSGEINSKANIQSGGNLAENNKNLASLTVTQTSPDKDSAQISALLETSKFIFKSARLRFIFEKLKKTLSIGRSLKIKILWNDYHQKFFIKESELLMPNITTHVGCLKRKCPRKLSKKSISQSKS